MPKLPFYYETKAILNGYQYNIYSADNYLVGVIYGSTNPMWDFVLGAKEGLETTEAIIKAMNK